MGDDTIRFLIILSCTSTWLWDWVLGLERGSAVQSPCCSCKGVYVQFPPSTSGSSQQPVTPAPGNLLSSFGLDSARTCIHVRVSHRHTHIHGVKTLWKRCESYSDVGDRRQMPSLTTRRLNSGWKFDAVNSAWCWPGLGDRHVDCMLLFPCIPCVLSERKGEWFHHGRPDLVLRLGQLQ